MKLFEIKNKVPAWMLVETALKGINPHLEHVEDLIFNSGYAGAVAALNHIESLRGMLGEGTGTTTQLTVKWDGCVHEDTIILTNHGDKTIKEIVQDEASITTLKIVGKDLDNDEVVNTLLFATQCKIGDKQWIEVFLEDGTSVKLTEDHEVHTTNRGWVAAGQLTDKDDITEL